MRLVCCVIKHTTIQIVKKVISVIPLIYKERPEIGILWVPRIQDRIEFHLNWGAPLGHRRPVGLEDLEPETTTSEGIKTLDVYSTGTSSGRLTPVWW